MKKILKVTLIILLVALIIIQLFKPAKNAAAEIPQNQITAKVPVPDNVMEILKVSCYDCHSNTTKYPWYSRIQPVAWFLDNHIQEGKHHLNFSEFAQKAARVQYKQLDEIGKEVKEGDMPLTSYTLIHRDAILNEQQKLAIENWVATSRKEMEAKFPPDSLKRKK